MRALADGVESSDEELWQRVRDADAEAYALLYRRHAPAVLNHCFRRGGDWAQAEDATSMVFLETWRQRDRVQVAGGASLLPWLLGVANNVLRRHRRVAFRHRNALARLHVAVAQPDHADLVAQRLDDRARLQTTLSAMRRLTRVEQETVALCVWAGLSYADAAVAMGVPLGTVRSRLSRARARLASVEDELIASPDNSLASIESSRP